MNRDDERAFRKMLIEIRIGNAVVLAVLLLLVVLLIWG
jgi:hypothetical protein